MNKNFLYEVVPIRLFLIVLLVFYHAFAIYSGAWEPIEGYPNIEVYSIMAKLAYACLLETFVFISGYIFGYQVRIRGKLLLSFRSIIFTKFKRLLIPSMIFSLLYFVIFNNFNQPIFQVINSLLKGVGHMWFLPMLFWCFVGIYVIEKLNIDKKTIFIFLIFAIYCSYLPLPFRINNALYYMIFFYMGYYLKKNGKNVNIAHLKVYIPLSLILFILFFTVKLNLDNILPHIQINSELTEYTFIGGGGNLLIINKLLKLLLSLSIRFICAAFGVATLYMSSILLITTIDLSHFPSLITLSNCCFGVYIFQQFILKLVYNSTLPHELNPFLTPWYACIFALSISLLITYYIRKTSIGKMLL